MYEFQVRSSDCDLGAVYSAPDKVIQTIRDGSKDVAQALVKYLIDMQDAFKSLLLTDKKNLRYKVEDEHKFLIDFDEKDQAMSEINQDLIIRKGYELETSKLIKEVIKLGDTVVDVGASIGHFTLLLAKAVGEQGTVYSFEPTKNQFPYLEANIKANGYENVVTENMGAWDENTTIELQVNAGSRFPLRVVKLDDVLPPKIDFIKIDVDGAEPHVLKGLIKTIENNPQLKMVIEYYPEYIKKLSGNPQDVLDVLDRYFTYRKIENDYGDGYWNYYAERK